MSDPRDKTNLTASDDNVPFGGSGSPSPIKMGLGLGAVGSGSEGKRSFYM